MEEEETVLLDSGEEEGEERGEEGEERGEEGEERGEVLPSSTEATEERLIKLLYCLGLVLAIT